MTTLTEAKAAIVKLSSLPGGRADVEQCLRRMNEVVEEEPGTLVYSFHRDDADPDVLWSFEIYANAEALASHLGSSSLKLTAAELRPLLARPPEIHPLSPVDTYGLGALDRS